MLTLFFVFYRALIGVLACEKRLKMLKLRVWRGESGGGG